MAAVEVAGGVMMADADRGIEYFLPDCVLDRQEIMRRYDANDRTEYRPEPMDSGDFFKLLGQLRAAALKQ